MTILLFQKHCLYFEYDVFHKTRILAYYSANIALISAKKKKKNAIYSQN